MGCWSLLGANSNLIRKGSCSWEGATCKGVVKLYVDLSGVLKDVGRNGGF